MAKLITAALLMSFAVAIQATACPAGDFHKYGYTGGCATVAAKFAFPGTATDANGLVDLLRHKFGAVKIPASITAVTDLASITAGTFADTSLDGKSIKIEKEAAKGAVMDWYPLIYATWPKSLAAATKLECGAWHDCKKIQMICVIN